MTKHLTAKADSTGARPYLTELYLHATVTDGTKSVVGRDILVQVEAHHIVSLLGFALKYNRDDLLQALQKQSEYRPWDSSTEKKISRLMQSLADKIGEEDD